MPLEFFSPEWCAAARSRIAADPEPHRGFADPKSFNHTMYLGVTDRQRYSYATFVEGTIVDWTSGPAGAEADLGMEAPLTAWHHAVTGTDDAAKLLMAGRLRLTAGSIQVAIRNSGALNRFVRMWRDVDTDWDV